MVGHSMAARRKNTALRFGVVAGVVGWWLSGSLVVWADIYVYRDARGVMHFTNVPTKPVYRPFQLLQPYIRSLRGKESAAFDQLILESCQRYGVEFALVKAVIKAESAFDPLALSRAGARGLMQLMPDTAALHGVTDMHDPRDNIDGGVRHLRLLLDRFRENLTLTLAAYNAGPEAVSCFDVVHPYHESL